MESLPRLYFRALQSFACLVCLKREIKGYFYNFDEKVASNYDFWTKISYFMHQSFPEIHKNVLIFRGMSPYLCESVEFSDKTAFLSQGTPLF